MHQNPVICSPIPQYPITPLPHYPNIPSFSKENDAVLSNPSFNVIIALTISRNVKNIKKKIRRK
jgi:hypothetical protein